MITGGYLLLFNHTRINDSYCNLPAWEVRKGHSQAPSHTQYLFLIKFEIGDDFFLLVGIIDEGRVLSDNQNPSYFDVEK